MLTPTLFRRFGFHVEPGFLDALACARLRRAAAASEQRPATIMRGEEPVVDEERRRTLLARPSDPASALAETRLEAIRPALEHRFGLHAAVWEPPRCLRYRTGDFFVVHRDRSDARAIRHRRVSLVVFLNDTSEVPREDTFGGGELIFYRLLDDPRLHHVGFGIRPEIGLLVAFPSDVLHEVTRVTHGERHTMVTWLSERDDAPGPLGGDPSSERRTESRNVED